MKQHIRVSHLGERLFACPHCDFSADGRRRLESHIKNAHASISVAAEAANEAAAAAAAGANR